MNSREARNEPVVQLVHVSHRGPNANTKDLEALQNRLSKEEEVKELTFFRNSYDDSNAVEVLVRIMEMDGFVFTLDVTKTEAALDDKWSASSILVVTISSEKTGFEPMDNDTRHKIGEAGSKIMALLKERGI